MRHQKISQEELYLCRCSTTSLVDQKTMKKEYESNARLVSLYAKRFESRRWSFLGLGSEKKWCSISADSPQGEWDRVAELMMIKFGERRHPVSVPRVHCPEERFKAKEVENYQYTSALMEKRLKLFFSHNYFC